MNVHRISSDRPGGVVACIERLAAEVGAEMLRRGGNAADAAVATAFAQGVVNPVHCGIAGGFHGLFFDARSGRAQVVSSDGRAPRAAHERIWADKLAGRWGATWKVKGDLNRLGYEASMVPGFVRGAHLAFTRFGSGRVSWREVIEPAIRLAAEGFLVYPYLYRLWMQNGFLEFGDGPRILGFTQASSDIYLHNGRVYEIGEQLIQADYARTLERVAEQGPDEFYEGETGQRIAADFVANGGFLSADDLREYRAEVVDPISTTFRALHGGHRVGPVGRSGHPGSPEHPRRVGPEGARLEHPGLPRSAGPRDASRVPRPDGLDRRSRLCGGPARPLDQQGVRRRPSRQDRARR